MNKTEHMPILEISLGTVMAVALAAVCFLFPPSSSAQILLPDDEPVAETFDGAGLGVGLDNPGPSSGSPAFGVASEASWTGRGNLAGTGEIEVSVVPGDEPLTLNIVLGSQTADPSSGQSAENASETRTVAGVSAILCAEMVSVGGRLAVALILSEGGPEGRLHSFWVDGGTKALKVTEIGLVPIKSSGPGSSKELPLPEGALVFRRVKAGDGSNGLELLLMDGTPYESSAAPMISRVWALRKQGWTPCEVPLELKGTPLSRLMRLGDEHFLKSDYPRASIYYERAVQADPLSGRAPEPETVRTPAGATEEFMERAYLYLGKSRERSLDLGGAILAYQAFIDRFPLNDLAQATQDDASFLDDLRRFAPEAGKAFIAARTSFEAGSCDETRKALDLVLADSRTQAVPVLNCRARYLSGLVREKTGDTAGAIADYKLAMGCPDDPSTSRQAAMAVSELGK